MRTVLIVDDDREARESLELILQHCGHEVRCAEDGPQALQIAEEFRPNVVLLDIQMPHKDGYTVCREMRCGSCVAHSQIYALSALSGPQHHQRCTEAGFDAWLVKPIEIDSLTALLSPG